MKQEEVFREEIPRPYSSFINELEEENRKLKEERDFFKEQAILWRNDYKNEYEENRKLNERIRFLEQCLDNKEKVNKSLREDNKKLKNSIEYRKKKTDKNQEKANQIDKIMNLP